MSHGSVEVSKHRIEVNYWQKVPDAERRYFAAALRHLTAWQRGERLDPETGLSHLSHAMCCLVFLGWFDARGRR